MIPWLDQRTREMGSVVPTGSQAQDRPQNLVGDNG